MSEHYTRAEDVPRLTAAWIEELMQFESVTVSIQKG